MLQKQFWGFCFQCGCWGLWLYRYSFLLNTNFGIRHYVLMMQNCTLIGPQPKTFWANPEFCFCSVQSGMHRGKTGSSFWVVFQSDEWCMQSRRCSHSRSTMVDDFLHSMFLSGDSLFIEPFVMKSSVLLEYET